MIGFPIFLTRILSSMLCGLITIAVLLLELHFYKIDCLDKVITSIGELSYTVNIVFFSGVFFLGEIVTGVAEIFVFDPMFSNARKTCDIKGKLENVSGYARAKEDTRTIKFHDIIEVSKKDCATFALSEMYFNIHRILGGMFILLSLLTIMPLILWLGNHPLTCLQFLVLVFGNLLLAWFSHNQAWKQRTFANNLIFYSAHSQTKHRIYRFDDRGR